MENLLLRYMDERIKEKEHKPVIKNHGPVLTISRETGCSANTLAEKVLSLIRTSATKKDDFPWHVVNKEIVMQAARELDIPADQVNMAFKGDERKLFDEILGALSSRYYKSYKTILKTITGVTKSIIDDGNVILVGRGGVAFTKDNHKALNVFLVAPLDWRIQSIIKRQIAPPKEAKAFVLNIDNERRRLIDQFYGKPTDISIYDVVYNCGSLDEDLMARNIFTLMKERNLV